MSIVDDKLLCESGVNQNTADGTIQKDTSNLDALFSCSEWGSVPSKSVVSLFERQTVIVMYYILYTVTLDNCGYIKKQNNIKRVNNNHDWSSWIIVIFLRQHDDFQTGVQGVLGVCRKCKRKRFYIMYFYLICWLKIFIKYL